MTWLGDCVYSVRVAAVLNLQKLTKVFGVDWAKQTIMPKLFTMSSHLNYMFRMTTVFALTVIKVIILVDFQYIKWDNN